MKKAWDTHSRCTRCKKTRTKNELCAKCSKLKPLAHLLARVEVDLGYAGDIYVWCTLTAPIRNITVMLSPRDAWHQGYAVCEDCLMARDT